MTRLRRHMLADMQAVNLPDETQKQYITEVAGLAAHYQRSPERLDRGEVLTYLGGRQRTQASDEYALTLEAIRFFYTQTLGRSWAAPAAPRGQRRGDPPKSLRQRMIDERLSRTLWKLRRAAACQPLLP